VWQNKKAEVVEMTGAGTLIKKKIKYSSYIRKFIVEQLQSNIYEEGLPNI
jgi:hypothetical protein